MPGNKTKVNSEILNHVDLFWRYDNFQTRVSSLVGHQIGSDVPLGLNPHEGKGLAR